MRRCYMTPEAWVSLAVGLLAIAVLLLVTVVGALVGVMCRLTKVETEKDALEGDVKAVKQAVTNDLPHQIKGLGERFASLPCGNHAVRIGRLED